MTTAKSCISAVFADGEPRGVCGPLHADNDQVLGGVGPDVGEPVGELDGARRARERPDEFLTAVSAEFGTHGVDLKLRLRLRQVGGVIGESCGGIECRRCDGHRATHTVGPVERQRQIAIPRLAGPPVGNGDGDPRCSRIVHLSHRADSAFGRCCREAEKRIGWNGIRHRRLNPGSRRTVVPAGWTGRGGGRTGSPGPGGDPVDAPGAPRERSDRQQAGHTQRRPNGRRPISHAKRQEPIPFPRLDMADQRGRRSPAR